MKLIIILLLVIANVSVCQFTIQSDTTKPNTLLITSEPSGSEVFINETQWGNTPLEINKLPQLPFTLRIEDKDGNLWNSNIFEIPFGNNIHALINQDYALVKIFTNPSGADLYLNDSLVGKTPYGETKIPLGITKVSLKKEGYRIWESGVAARREKSQLYLFNIKLESIYSELNFSSVLQNICVDNVPVDKGPGIFVRSGEHVITAVHPGRTAKMHLDAVVKSGETYSISLKEKQFFFSPVLFSALLPGTGQFSDGAKLKGILTFLVTSGFTTAAVITSGNYAQKAKEYNLLREEYLNAGDEVSAIGARTIMEAGKLEADKALKMKKVTFGLAIGTYLYNIADALVFHSFKDVLQMNKLDVGFSYDPGSGSGNFLLDTKLKF